MTLFIVRCVFFIMLKYKCFNLKITAEIIYNVFVSDEKYVYPMI